MNPHYYDAPEGSLPTNLPKQITLEQVRKLVAAQAEDECLWAPATHIETGYAQQALRVLTKAIEGELCYEDALAEILDMMP